MSDIRPKTAWDAEGLVEGVAWHARLDNRYLVEVQYVKGGDGYRGTLLVFDHADGDRLVHAEPTGISYAARFGADVADVAEWQERAAEVVDNPKKRKTP